MLGEEARSSAATSSENELAAAVEETERRCPGLQPPERRRRARAHALGSARQRPIGRRFVVSAGRAAGAGQAVQADGAEVHLVRRVGRRHS
jgi:hypothetical protein